MATPARPVVFLERGFMRKWFWTGEAFVALAMAGTYMAADHAVRYPDSFLGRCAHTFRNLAPVFGAGQDTKPATTVAQQPACKPAPAPEPEAFEPLNVETWEPAEITLPGLTLPPPLPSFEESDAPIPAMPLAVEDENMTGRCMPYADQDEEELDFEVRTDLPEHDGVDLSRRAQPDTPMNIWRWIWPWHVPETMPQSQTPVPDTTVPVEESEALPDLPGLREDPHHDYHYPSCPYTGNGRCPLPPPRYVPPMPPVGPPSPPNNATPNN